MNLTLTLRAVALTVSIAGAVLVVMPDTNWHLSSIVWNGVAGLLWVSVLTEGRAK